MPTLTSGVKIGSIGWIDGWRFRTGGVIEDGEDKTVVETD